MISVIMPFYNNETTVLSCIDSVLKQSVQDFELIAVNDGSTDHSAEWISELKDPRIRLIEQENSGVSAARNNGLRHAKGKYCTFIDADDAYAPEFMSTLLNCSTYDLAGCAIKYPANAGVSVSYSFECYDKQSISNQMEALLNASVLNSPVTKLYQMSMINQHSLSFREDMTRGEDFNFNFRYLLCCNSLKIVPDELYLYNMGEGLHNRIISNVIEQRRINIDLIEAYYQAHHFEMNLINQMKLKLIYIYCMQECQGKPDMKKIKQELFVPYFESIGPVTGKTYRLMKLIYQTHNVSLMLWTAKQMQKMKNSGRRIDGASL